MTTFVDIVGVAKQGVAGAVGEPEQESTAKPPVLRASGSLNISDISHLILGLQVHIHHELLLIHLITHSAIEFCVLLIDLDVLDGEIGQVLHQDLLVATHEGTGAELQFLHHSTIDEYLSVIVDRNARHLVYQVIQHGAVG